MPDLFCLVAVFFFIELEGACRENKKKRNRKKKRKGKATNNTRGLLVLSRRVLRHRQIWGGEAEGRSWGTPPPSPSVVASGCTIRRTHTFFPLLLCLTVGSCSSYAAPVKTAPQRAANARAALDYNYSILQYVLRAGSVLDASSLARHARSVDQLRILVRTNSDPACCHRTTYYQ